MELLDTLTGWIIGGIGLLIGVLSLIATIVTAKAAHRSAHAAEQSVDVARQASGAAEASAEVAAEALRHEQEAEARRARSTVAALAIRIKAEREKAEKLAQRLLLEHQVASGFFGRSSLLDLKKAELQAVPDELKEYAATAETLDVESGDLSQFSREELERLHACLRADLTRLELRSEAMSEERGDVQRNVWLQRMLDALRKLVPPPAPPGRGGRG